MDVELKHAYVRTNGVTLHVVEAGPENGRLVILLHGFPEFWYCWKHQIPALAQAGYRVIVPDQRGYNLSEKPKGIAAYNLDNLADDVLGLAEAYGQHRFLLAGHDWGAAVAWWLANRNPERLEKLTILNVPHHAVMRRHVQSNFRQTLRSWYIFFFQLPFLPEALNSVGNYRGMTQALVGSSRPGTFTEDDLAQYRAAWSQPGAMTGMINWYRAIMRKPPQKLSSPRIAVPTLVIWGAKDRFLGRELAEPSVALCDNGRLVFIEEATHWVQHEEPARVNDLLLGFLGES
ncbi:MAG: alpha/beta hydrolase [Chloroflexi bacterium]|nr:MAG: alpha/beta hydrolase [Chloroflexota bacterium]